MLGLAVEVLEVVEEVAVEEVAVEEEEVMVEEVVVVEEEEEVVAVGGEVVGSGFEKGFGMGLLSSAHFLAGPYYNRPFHSFPWEPLLSAAVAGPCIGADTEDSHRIFSFL